MTDSSPGTGHNPPKLDTAVPHSARVWNYWLGGQDAVSTHYLRRPIYAPGRLAARNHSRSE